MFLVPVQQHTKRKPRGDHQQTTAMTSVGDEVLNAAAANHQQQHKVPRRHHGPAAAGAGPPAGGSNRRLYAGGSEFKETNVGRVSIAALGGVNSHSQSSVYQQDRKAWHSCDE